jgi:light-regulated signal transduction histidine kinase (bacteriophytochrome)
MDGMEIYTIINSALTLICGGGWFINWRAKKRKESAEARQTELNATITEQDMYQQMLKDIEEHNERLRRFNTEISEECEQLRKRVAENDTKLREQGNMIREQEKKLAVQENKIASLEHRLELVTDMMCGKANCQQRTRVFLSPIDDDSFTTRKDKNQTEE